MPTDSAEILLKSCQSIRKSPNAQHKDHTIWLCHLPPSTFITLISDSEQLWRIGARSSPALIAGENSKRRDADQGADNSPIALCTHRWILSAPHWKIKLSLLLEGKIRIKPLVITVVRRSPHYFEGKDLIPLHITRRKWHAYLMAQKGAPKPKGTVKILSSSPLPVLKMQPSTASLSDPSSFSSVNMTRVHREWLWQQTCISYILWPLPAVNPCQDGWHQSALVLPQNNIKKKLQPWSTCTIEVLYSTWASLVLLWPLPPFVVFQKLKQVFKQNKTKNHPFCMKKMKSNSIFYVKQQKKSNCQWAGKCIANGSGRTAHPRFNGWAQICRSSKKKEQILLGSIKQSCSPDSYFMLTARDSITDSLLKCAGCFQLLRTKNLLWALSQLLQI